MYYMQEMCYTRRHIEKEREKMKQAEVKCNECNELISVYINNRFMANHKIPSCSHHKGSKKNPK